MAFPDIPTAAGSRVLTAVQANTTASRTFPNQSSLTKNAGDLIIAICWGYQTSAGTPFTLAGGFTQLVNSAGTSLMCVAVGYKWSTGSESGTFSWTQAATVTGHAAMILMSISGADGSTAPEATAKANGTTSAADPASLSPSWGADDTLWIVTRGAGETSTSGTFTALSTPPTNYSDSVQTGISGDVVGGVEAGVAFRQLNAASEDVGPGTCDTSNARNSALVIAVRPPAPVPAPRVLVGQTIYSQAVNRGAYW